MGSATYRKALNLRYSLFFEEFDLPKEVTADDLEAISTHIAITEGDELLAYGRLSRLEKNEFRISQIVVSPAYQNQGLSKTLLKKLMAEAKNQGASLIRLGAQESAAGLYESVGFQPAGEVYTVKLTGVPHVRMVYEVDT